MMSVVGYRMLPVYARALGMPSDFFADRFRDPTLIVRMVRYPAVGPLRADQFGASSHPDAGFTPTLPQARDPALTIKTPDGEWLDHPVVERGRVGTSGNIL